MLPTIERVETCPRCNRAYESDYHKIYCGSERTPPAEGELSYDGLERIETIFDTPIIYGSDWSHWNEVNVKKAADLGVKFCYIKITESTNFVDDKAKRYFDLCGEYGIRRSFYHYLKCGVSGAKQAKHMHDTIIEKGCQDVDLPIALDAEDPLGARYSKNSNANNIYKFAKFFQGFAGYPEIMIYTRASWWNPYVAYIYDWHLLSLWVAHWGAGGNPTLPTPWAKNKIPQMIHQYGTMQIGGARVDANKWNSFYKFPGDEPEPVEPPEPPEPPEPVEPPEQPETFYFKGEGMIGDQLYHANLLFSRKDTDE